MAACITITNDWLRNPGATAALSAGVRRVLGKDKFFRQALRTNGPRRVGTVDTYRAAYRALRRLRREHPAWRRAHVRTNKYLNGIVEEDYRGHQARTGPTLGSRVFSNATTVISCVELIRWLKKSQFKLGQFGAHRKTRPFQKV